MVTTKKQQTQTKQPPPATDDSQQTKSNEQTPSVEAAFSQILDQQIAQAIRPVLDEFRQQITQELEHQTAPAAPSQTSGQADSVQAPAPPEIRLEDQQATSQAPQQEKAGQPQQKTSPAESAGQANVQRPASGALTEMLRPGLEQVEHQVEPVLRSALGTLVSSLLAESTHAIAQQQAERGLHAFLARLFEAVPDTMNNQEMLDKTEGLLQAMLREFLDVVFAEATRATVQQKSQLAIQDSFQGDFGGAVRAVGDLLKAIVEALIVVLRRNQGNLVRLALALALLALAGYIAQSDSDQKNHEQPSAS